MDDLDAIDFNLSFNNFDPNDIQVEETINAVFVVDVSPSIESYVKDLNHAFNDFTETMQKSHVADQLLVSIIEFCEDVEVISGFQPIRQIPKMKFVPKGNGTSLYDAFDKGLSLALTYRQNLEASGVNAKTLIFTITDGGDNSSSQRADVIQKKLKDILSNEKNAFSFTTVLFGVGDAAQFEQAQQALGIQHLAKVGTSGAEIRKMISFISQSIASTANNAKLSF